MENGQEDFKEIESSIKMSIPNEIINIHKGEFKILLDETELIISGLIYFNWFPNKKILFEGRTNISASILTKLYSGSDLSLVVNDILLCKCIITSYSMGGISKKDGSNLYIEGSGKGQSVFGDKSIRVQKVRFAVPNLRDIVGNTITKEGYVNDRKLIFDNNEYVIKIEKSKNFQSQKELLHKKGGYILLYSGEITNLKESISLNEVSDALHCFSNFLKFLNGTRCAPVFREGIYSEEVIWFDYTPYNADQYKPVISWIPEISSEGLNHIWCEFSALWSTQKDFLITAIHWYLEASAQSGLLDGAIIMAQTGLELLYNWLLVENKKFIIGKDAEAISASNKIRLLLSLLNISNDVPIGLSNLNKLIKDSEDIIDGPEAFVQIRNAIVHSQASKRNKIASMDNMVKYEALQLGLWYLELSILYVLDYKGKYSNRCSNEAYSYGSESFVPWLKK